jgi:hypothetical protein
LSQIRKIAFRLGSTYLTLEVPPFYVDFEKRRFSSIVVRRRLPNEGIAIYVYVTRHRHVEKFLLLRRLHPDVYLPEELRSSGTAMEEMSQQEFQAFVRATKIQQFARDVVSLEKEWEYAGNGVWQKQIGSFTLYMILIVKDARWTVRPAISRKDISGYGFEIPVDTSLSQSFKEALKPGELEEIHDHVDSHHFHLAIDSLERCSELAQQWDYYFSTRTRWRQTVFLSFDEECYLQEDISPVINNIVE